MAADTKISEAELQVMRVLWTHDNPKTANEVVDALMAQTDWNHRTIRTLLNRLVKKKAIAFDPDKRPFAYYPLVSRDDALRKERQSFVEKFYNGAMMPMLAEFLEDRSLSDDDIEKLKEMLNKRQ
ncbi:BlaI/MecI/CopY family transcriptional regulator [Planctomycetota bacterium]